MMRKSPGIGFYWVFLILGAGYAPFCDAIEPRTLYVSEKGGNAIDPKTQAPLERLPPSYKLSEPFLLNSQGDRYERGKGQSPYLGPDGKIYVGFYLPTNPQRLAAVEVGQLATLAPPALAIRTPEVSLADISNHELMALSCQYVQAVPPELTQLLSIWPALKEKLNPDMSQAMKFVRQFHNTLCESRRDPRQAQTLDLEIKALETEWQDFIDRQKSDADRKAARLAREIDLVTRTVTFEAHPLGELDGKQPEDCKSDVDCPVSGCERDAIALSIRNRGLHVSCKGGKRSYLGCSFKGDFAGAATLPTGYSIWLPNWAHPFIASCFLRGGVGSGKFRNFNPETGKNYLKRALAFERSLQNVAKVIYADDLQKLFAYRESGDGPKQSLDRVLNYYHPQSMIGCNRDSYANLHTVGAAYIERDNGKGKDYDLLMNRKLVPVGATASSGLTGFLYQNWHAPAKQAQLRETGTENISYEMIPFENQQEWRVPVDQLQKISTKTPCLPMGLAILQSQPAACPNVPKARSFTAPFWSLKGVKRATIGCKTADKRIVDCDLRFQPISGVN